MIKKELSANKKITINLIASLISYIITFGISFFLSPYIVQTIGVEANGFVGLANNFISYASLITVALDSMAGRFITVKIYEKDYEGANKYYSSVFLSNCFISFMMLIAAVGVWVYLESLIEIPAHLLWDVKILFAALFLNCILNTACSVFDTAAFATNNLYLSSLRSIEASVIRAGLLISLFAFFAPRVSYLGITSLLMGIYCILFNVYYTKKLLPFIRISRKNFDFHAVFELLRSGLWALVNRLGQILNDGLDLLITNIFINPVAMGELAVAKTIPNIINSIIGCGVGAFTPNFTILYAQNEKEKLFKSIKQSMKIMGVIANVPMIVLIVCGMDFFALWQPTLEARKLQILVLLSAGCTIISGGINCLYSIFTVVNKLRTNSIVVVACGAISTLITYFLLKTTSLGIYAVAGVSTVVSIIRNLVFTLPYGAACLKFKWYSFYSEVLRSVVFVAVSVAAALLATSLAESGTWLALVIKCTIVGVISLVIGFFVILGREERQVIMTKFKGVKN